MPTSEQTGLLIPAGATMATENRKHPRHVVLDKGTLRLAVRPEFRGRRGVLVNISIGGIGFLLGDALEADAAIVVELHSALGDLTRRAHVRYCRTHATPADAPWLPPRRPFLNLFRRVFGLSDPEPAGQAWMIGCEFDQPLSDAELQQILASLNGFSDG